MNSYKLALIGDAGVGKTNFVNRNLAEEFEQRYIATQGVKVTHISFNMGQITLEVHDFAGQEKFGKLNELFDGTKCAIVMFDLTSKVTFKNVKPWVAAARKSNPYIPIILCGNKCDIADRKVNQEDITAMVARLNLMSYYDVSAKNAYQFMNPLLDFVSYFYGY